MPLHGSWNKYNGKSGYKTNFIQLDENGNYLKLKEDFITGWLSNENAWGRPVASPFIMSDGSMIVSDDKFDVNYNYIQELVLELVIKEIITASW